MGLTVFTSLRMLILQGGEILVGIILILFIIL